MRPDHVTIAMAYYENPSMLQRHYEVFAKMPAPVRRRLRLIVVDDGSPLAPAAPEDCGVALSVYRMDVDVRWNQDACRNLAVDRAADGWLLLTDIDHIVPHMTAFGLLSTNLNESRVYRFARVSEPDYAPYKPHPNSWLMTKRMYDQIGGYDERFAGLYGTDGDFRDRVRANAEVEMLDLPLVRVPREVTPDASTTTYLRKQAEDDEGIPRVKAERSLEPGWRPKRLTFPWHKVI